MQGRILSYFATSFCDLLVESEVTPCGDILPIAVLIGLIGKAVHSVSDSMDSHYFGRKGVGT